MNFLNSPYLWGGLIAAGIAVPAIIHLLSRYRSQPVDWAAMELLRRAMVLRARNIRLEDLILLFLRCLGIALVGLALVRPALTATSASWFGGRGGGAGVVIAIDASYSMGHKPGVRSRFESACDRAREIAGTMNAGSPVTLVLLGSSPRVLLRNAPYDPERVDTILKAARTLDEGINLEACLEELRGLVDELRVSSRECYIVTDAQAATWKTQSENARRAMEDIGRAGSLLFVPVAAGDGENLAITRFVLASGVLRRDSEARYVADVKNTGRSVRTGVNVQLFMDSAAVDQRVIESIAPGKTESVSLFCRFDKAGAVALSGRIGNDALQADNSRWAVANIPEKVRVLCVDGDPADDVYAGETGFLLDALQPLGKEASGQAGGEASLEVDRIRIEDLRIASLSTCDIVVLANVAEIISEHAVALADFVRRGGGLLVFLGDRVNAELMNRRFQDPDGRPLLPARLEEAVNGKPAAAGSRADAAVGAVLSPVIPDNPLTRFLGAMPREQFGQIGFQRYFKVTPGSDAAVLLRLAGSEDPLLLEQDYGRGKVVLFTSSADRDWTDMPVHPAFLMLVQQAITCMTRLGSETPVTVPGAIAFEVPDGDQAASVAVVNPGGVESSVRVGERNGARVAVLEATAGAGIYEARFGQNGAGVKAAANPDAAESDVSVLTDGELRAAMAGLPMRIVNEGESMLAVSNECRFGRELWPFLLVLALCVLAAEAMLARRFVSRMEHHAGQGEQ
ncbi:MAG: BatA domain-containing protein [bacterium]